MLHFTDVAFVDRADIKAYVGPPTLEARYEILRSCLQELLRTGILQDSRLQDEHNLTLPNFAGLKEKLNGIALPESQGPVCLCKQLLEVAEASEGMSGRSLRKLPFIAHASLAHPYGCAPRQFLESMIETARRERSEMPD